MPCWHRSTVCDVQRRWWHSMPDIIRPWMVSNRDNSMPRPRLSDRVCCPRAMIACHARHHSTRCMLSKSDDGIHARRILTMCIGQRTLLHATPDILRSCILSKGDDVMRRLTSSHRVCCPRVMMACDARRRPTACAKLRKCKIWGEKSFLS